MGWGPIITHVEGQVNEDELIGVVGLRTRGPGQTPQRNEHATPPPPPVQTQNTQDGNAMSTILRVPSSITDTSAVGCWHKLPKRGIRRDRSCSRPIPNESPCSVFPGWNVRDRGPRRHSNSAAPANAQRRPHDGKQLQQAFTARRNHVFFFLVPVVPSVLGNFCLPLMIGARDMAFPREPDWLVHLRDRRGNDALVIFGGGRYLLDLLRRSAVNRVRPTSSPP